MACRCSATGSPTDLPHQTSLNAGSGGSGGGAIDAFDTEPLPAHHPFRRIDNVLTTPHIGYVTEELYRVFYHDPKIVFDDGEETRNNYRGISITYVFAVLF